MSMRGQVGCSGKGKSQHTPRGMARSGYGARRREFRAYIGPFTPILADGEWRVSKCFKTSCWTLAGEGTDAAREAAGVGAMGAVDGAGLAP
jgi:hypothetical protein